MPSWILPGRRNDSVMQCKAILAQSLAYSYKFNRRNIEYYWYPIWGQTLCDLVADVPNLMVASQYPAWFVPQDDQMDEEDRDCDDGDGKDDEGARDEDDPEEVIPEEPEAHALNIGGSFGADEEGESEENDLSFALTIPERKAKSVLVDFAIINVSGETYQKQKSRYGGWRITGLDVGLFVEVKRSASRSLKGAELGRELDSIIGEAREELVNQAAHLFLQNPNQDSVLAIAAAGQYWCNAKITRAHSEVKGLLHSLSARDPTYQAPSNQSSGSKVKWSSLLRLGIARSHDRLHTIYKNLKGMGVLEMLVDLLFARIARCANSYASSADNNKSAALQNGRDIVICGAIPGCNKDVKPTMGTTWVKVVTNRLTIQGFVVYAIFLKDGSNRVGTEAVPDTGALQRGDVKEAEEIVGVPFADIPKVWGRLLTGANTRKLVTKLRVLRELY